MKQQRNNKKYYVYILLFLLTWFIIDYYQSPLETRRIETSFIYANRTGFDLTPGSLRFGMIAENQTAQRNIEITNPYEFPITIEITSHGETKKGLRTKETNIKLEPKEQRTIIFTMTPENYKEYKEYKGEIHLTIRKHKNL